MKENSGTTISVREMGRRLGLKKVESYWLAHKGYFKLVQVAGRIRVELESFEYWYSGQVKYHKISGEPPGERLKSYTYSAEDIGEMLGIPTSTAYIVMKKAGVRFILVDYWKRFPKKEFDEWYRSQSRYRTKEDRERDEKAEKSSLSLPDIARLLDITRGAVYGILRKNEKQGFWDVFVIAGKKRVTKDSFESWYKGQSDYLKPEDRANYPEYQPKPSYDDQLRADYMDRQKKKRKRLGIPEPELVAQTKKRKPYVSNNEAFLTIEQAANISGKSTRTIIRWIQDKRFPAVILVPVEKSRIDRNGFEQYLNERKGTK